MSLVTPEAERRPRVMDAGRGDARALARERRDAMRRRTRRIRRSVAGLAMMLFAVAFLVVYVQLASGHDPALVANANRRATATGAASDESSSSESENSGTSIAGGETSGESSASGSEESSAASALTTSQS